MRDFPSSLAILCCAALALSGCKIVATPDPDAHAAETATQTDEARMADLAAKIWEPQVLPTVQQAAIPLPDLHSLLAQGLETAGAAHGLRAEGEGNAWNFAIKGEGTIITAQTQSRAAKLTVDVTADGEADLTIQLGPVVRGTALRDAMPFLIFSEFRDQIEFAKLARALNDLASARVTLPAGDLLGKSLRFEGVFTLRTAKDPVEIVPTVLQVP